MSDAPRRSGRLQDEPLPQLLGSLSRQKQTGIVRLSLTSGPAEIYLIEGCAVAVELPGSVDLVEGLVRLTGLRDSGALTDEQFEVAKERLLAGE